MQWVVGTGRCGMHNYTALEGGYISSAKEWKQNLVKKYHGDNYNKTMIRSVIAKRMQLPYPCITDCAQFMVIDEIAQIDRDAEFIWLIRDKEPCVNSLMQRIGEEDRIHPKGWEFKTERKKELIEWYYDEVNKIIGEKLKGKKYKVLHTDQMPLASLEDVEKLRKFA